MRFATLTLFVVLLFLPPLSQAQSTDSLSAEQLRGYKDPGTATLITVFLPGGGHIYAGEAGVGLGIMFVSAASIGAGTAYSNCLGRSSDNCSDAPLYIGLGVHLANWVYSLIDAPRAAERHNRRLLSAGTRTQVRPVASVHGDQPAGGFELRIQF